MSSVTLPSFAKINWTLEILGKRPDGYHELRTLLQTIDVADELTFESRAHGVELLSVPGACPTALQQGFPLDDSNLICRAARLLAEHTGCQRGVRITIKKNLPLAAGLGGGSSNAAVTLLALQQLWDIKLPPAQLFALGAQLGADVPFFFVGGTCIGVGRGAEVYPTTEFHAQHLLLVNAGIPVATREVYGNLPAELTRPARLHKMPDSLQAAYAVRGASLSSLKLHNDLEAAVLPRYPLLAEIHQQLHEYGAQQVLMSGSGSTIFGLFDSATMCANAAQTFQTISAANGWWCVSAGTMDRVHYQQQVTMAEA